MNNKTMYEVVEKAASWIAPRKQFTTRENEWVNHWVDAEIDAAYMEFAYDKCVSAIGRVSLPYINSLIENWLGKGLRTVEEVKTYCFNAELKRKTRNVMRFENGIEHEFTPDEIKVIQLALQNFNTADLFCSPEREQEYLNALEHLRSLFLHHLD